MAVLESEKDMRIRNKMIFMREINYRILSAHRTFDIIIKAKKDISLFILD